MSRNKILALSLSAAMLVGGSIALAACKDGSSEESGTVTNQGVNTDAQSGNSGSGNNGSENSGSSGKASSGNVELLKLTEKDQDITYDEGSAQKIELSENIGKINITKEGTYIVTGSTNNGMIIINVSSEEDVHLILRDCSINSETSAAIYVISADEVYITLEGENTLSNGGSFVAIDSNDIDSVIYAKDDLTMNGNGSVTITSPAGHGIVCKDDLVMTGGTYTITAKEDGINTNDSALFTAGTFTIDCKDDAIHTDGMLEFEGGVYTIDAAEGLEGTYVLVNDGDFTIDASDDGINAGQKSDAYYPTVEINGGYVRITMAQGDTDGIDANGNLYINGGTVEVNAQFPFDYDNVGQLNGGTVIVNGEEVTELSNQTFGGPGGGPGGFGGPGSGGQRSPGGQGGPGGDFNPEDFQDGQFPEGMTPPEGFQDGEFSDKPM
ncbi:MAG: carbohydrate-binding domain-containing protein [Clostridiales bacterium]|nr:carbohydrate-binding domain-containing protein [Clostridiales bacterium]